MRAETTAPKQRGRPFPKGQSGNPNGRPVGARNGTTLAVEALLDGEAENLTRKAVALALKGNVACLRLCLDRIVPPRRGRPLHFAIPTLNSPNDAAKAIAAIATAVALGDLTTTEAGELSRLIEAYVKAIEFSDIERRIQILEEKRLSQLERKAHIHDPPPPVIFVRFVAPGRAHRSSWARCLDGDQAWERRTGETEEAFERRVSEGLKRDEHSPSVVLLYPESKTEARTHV
jgi:Family of unknown function (DUF5681)